MNLQEYARFDGLGLAELVRSKQVRPRELCDLALAAVEQVNPQLNAVIETFADRPETEAASDPPPGPFRGVPMLVKDFPFEGDIRAEMGCQLAEGLRVDRDSTLMCRFRAAGLVNLGRTTSSELGLAAATESRLAGRTCNPWDVTRSTAGSSGGSAAIVAAGAVPIASGGDGGGSIRMPASFCGIVGLKPTRGRVTAPGDADSLSGLALSFALMRSVRDCAALLDAVAGPELGDPYRIAPPARSYLEEIKHPPSRLRIGFTTTAWSELPVDADVAEAVRSVAAICANLGHTVDEAAPEIDYEPYLEAQKVIWCAYTARGVSQIARATGRKPSERNLQTTTWATYLAGLDVTAESFIDAVAHYDVVVRRASAFFAEHDVLLTPTCTITPRALGTFDPDAPNATVDMIFDQLGPHETFTALFNATGQPAISLPLCMSREGLPIGVQFASRFGNDDVLLALARTLEEAMPWRDRVPPVHVGNV